MHSSSHSECSHSFGMRHTSLQQASCVDRSSSSSGYSHQRSANEPTISTATTVCLPPSNRPAPSAWHSHSNPATHSLREPLQLSPSNSSSFGASMCRGSGCDVHDWSQHAKTAHRSPRTRLFSSPPAWSFALSPVRSNAQGPMQGSRMSCRPASMHPAGLSRVSRRPASSSAGPKRIQDKVVTDAEQIAAEQIRVVFEDGQHEITSPTAAFENAARYGSQASTCPFQNPTLARGTDHWEWRGGEGQNCGAGKHNFGGK